MCSLLLYLRCSGGLLLPRVPLRRRESSSVGWTYFCRAICAQRFCSDWLVAEPIENSVEAVMSGCVRDRGGANTSAQNLVCHMLAQKTKHAVQGSSAREQALGSFWRLVPRLFLGKHALLAAAAASLESAVGRQRQRPAHLLVARVSSSLL